MATWRDGLQPASFRGVPFRVESDTRKIGRRNVVHVFPQRDSGVIEDLGAVGNGAITFQAYVIGSDYMAQRDALVAALNSGGPGVLVHPVYGKLTVNAGECEVSTSTREGGMATFSLVFNESGASVFAAPVADTAAAVADAGDLLTDDVALLVSARLAVDTAALGVSALAQVGSVLATLRGEVLTARAAVLRDPVRFADDLAYVDRNAVALLQAPADMAARVGSLYLQITDLGILSRLAAIYCGLVDNGAGAAADNANAINRLIAQSVLVAAANAATSADFATYDDAVSFRSNFSDFADAEADVVDPGSYAAVLDLSNAVWLDIDGRAATLARVVPLDVDSPTSSLELAQRLYGDAERAEEIATRNGVMHPGWCFGRLSVVSE